jgi:hypothetical protein
MMSRVFISVAMFSVTFLIASTQQAMGQGCPGSGQQSQGPDVIVGTLGQTQGTQQIENYTGSGGLDAFSVGTNSCNLGNAPLLWQAGPDTDHPVIGQNLLRLKQVNGSFRFEQVGQGWLKHAFTALAQNACCTCQNPGTGALLGIGCSDPYTASRNGGQSGAGPKWQVNATTGIHIHPIANPSFSGQMARRNQVAITDLEVSNTVGASTKYFVEGQYIAVDDASSGNKNNNASYRRVSVAGSGTNWTFGYFGTNPNVETQRQQAGIRAWGDHEAGVVETDIITPEAPHADPDLTVALVILAAKVTDLSGVGNGPWHYEYAMENLNSDRSISSFSVPVAAGITVTNIGFHDVDYRNGDGEGNVNRSGTDWPGVRNPNDVTWACTQTFAQNSNANALRWGTLYNFRFDADIRPSQAFGTTTLGMFKPGAINSINALTFVPHVCGDLDADLSVDGDDFAVFLQNFGHCFGVNPPSPFDADTDMDGDGCVTLVDYQQWLACYIAAGDGSVSAPPPPGDLGDMNADGAVNSGDIEQFTNVLLYPSQATFRDLFVADINGDGVRNVDDATGLVGMLLQP